MMSTQMFAFAGVISEPFLDLSSGYSSHKECFDRMRENRCRLPVGHRNGSVFYKSGEEVQKKNIVRHLKLESVLHGLPLSAKELLLDKPSFAINFEKIQSPNEWVEFDPNFPCLVVDIAFERILHQLKQKPIIRSRSKSMSGKS